MHDSHTTERKADRYYKYRYRRGRTASIMYGATYTYSMTYGYVTKSPRLLGFPSAFLSGGSKVILARREGENEGKHVRESRNFLITV